MAGARSSRQVWLGIFLWMAAIGWGIGLGAKLFDLVVLAGAYGASLPESLDLLPYGKRFPVNPGEFFQPLSAVMLLNIVAALIVGWRMWDVRKWLLLSLGTFLVIWAFTPTVFWPMIDTLYGIANGTLTVPNDEVIHTVGRWVAWDWGRVVVIGIGYVAVVRALIQASRRSVWR